MTKIESTIRNAIEPIINKLNYKIYDVIYEKESGENYLRIFIYNDNSSISIDDCEIVNNAITDLLDEKDFIKNEYILEVSSPGLERRIRDDEQLKYAISQKVDIKLYKKDEELKLKEIVGVLTDFNKENVYIKIDDINKNNKNLNKIDKKNNKDKRNDENDENSETKVNEIIAINKNNIAKMNTIFEM